MKQKNGRLGFPYTLNGTAIAVPRVLACLLENGWDEESRSVAVPECLRKWMPDNTAWIGPAKTTDQRFQELCLEYLDQALAALRAEAWDKFTDDDMVASTYTGTALGIIEASACWLTFDMDD